MDASMHINGIPACVNQSFYQQRFSDIEIQDIKENFHLQCVDCSVLPYKRAVEQEILSEGLGYTDKKNMHIGSCWWMMPLVTATSPYI